MHLGVQALVHLAPLPAQVQVLQRHLPAVLVFCALLICELRHCNLPCPLMPGLRLVAGKTGPVQSAAPQGAVRLLPCSNDDAEHSAARNDRGCRPAPQHSFGCQGRHRAATWRLLIWKPCCTSSNCLNATGQHSTAQRMAQHCTTLYDSNCTGGPPGAC